MTQPYIAQILVFGFTFAPRNYAFAQGQTIAISQNEALFSLIGTTYGGNGQTTFNLPNIQNRGVVNIGQGPGLSNYSLGEQVGVDTVTLNTSQMPTHLHQVYATAGSVEDLAPVNNGWFGRNAPPGRLYSDQTPDTAFSFTMLTTSGGGQPHSNDQPLLGLNYCIALYGIFPSRN